MNKIEVFRQATQKIVKILSDKNIKITQCGIKAYVRYDDRTGKPVQVNIPFIPDNATDDLLNAIQGFIDHEVAHILFSDFKVLKKATQDYPKALGLYGIIEDSHIERRMGRQFAGSGLNLRNVGEFFLRTFTDKMLAEKPEETVSVLFVPAIRAWAGQSVYIDYMKDKWHLMQQVVDALGDAVKGVAKCESSQDCLELAVKFQNLLEKSSLNRAGEDSQESDGDKKSDKPGASKDKKKSESKEKSEKSDEKSASSDEKSDSDSDEEPGEKSDGSDSDSDSDSEPDEADSGQGDGQPEDGGDNGDRGEGGKGTPSGESEGEEGEEGDGPASSGGGGDPAEVEDKSSTSIMEALANLGGSDFDDAVSAALTQASKDGITAADYFVYTKDKDIIRPLDTTGYASSHYLDQMLKAVDHMVGPLQKDLERAIAAKSKSVWVPGHRSGKLNGSSLARLVAFNDGRVFRRRHESTSKDVAVSLLVDCSGSMVQSNKIRIAAYAAYALSSVLERIGVTHEVLGFTTGSSLPSYSREEAEEMRAAGIVIARHAKLHIPIIKGFQDRVTPEIKTRFSCLPVMPGMNENVDGESVDIAANRLALCSQARKILIVLSDGQPACGGGSNILRKHLKETVKNVEKSGIDVLGIGILSTAVSEFYSKHIVLKNVDELPGAVIKEIKRLLIKN